MIRRFFLAAPLMKERYKLENEEYRHAKVLRLQVGDLLTLVNGKGQIAIARVEHLSKTAIDVVVESVETTQRSPYTTCIAMALIQPSRLEVFIEKAVEIGIDAIDFYAAEKGDKKTGAKQRAEKIAISAVKQCGRAYLPTFRYFSRLQDIPNDQNRLYYGYIGGNKQALQAGSQIEKCSCRFYIGPEKGFSEKELAHLEKWNALPVTLARHVLRAETAGMLAAYFLEKNIHLPLYSSL